MKEFLVEGGVIVMVERSLHGSLHYTEDPAPNVSFVASTNSIPYYEIDLASDLGTRIHGIIDANAIASLSIFFSTTSSTFFIQGRDNLGDDRYRLTQGAPTHEQAVKEMITLSSLIFGTRR